MIWTCPCGAINHGRFCGQCGMPPRSIYQPSTGTAATKVALVTFVLLFSFIFVLFMAPSFRPTRVPQAQSKETQNTATPATVPSEVVANTANEPETPPGVLPAPGLSMDEIHGLTKERQFDTDLIAAAQGILSAASVQSQVEIYCRFTVEQAQSLFGSAASGATKQQQEFVSKANINRCRAMILTGSQRMPDLDYFRDKTREAQQDIVEVDHKLATAQFDSDSAVPKINADVAP